jgi:hypothetical protein
MKLTIEIESDNIGVSSDYEVSEIVKKIAKRIVEGRAGGKIVDCNGNYIGEWDYERSEDEDEDESDED